MLNLSGWFDEMYGPAGAVENFLGAGDALVLGPWTHGVASVQRSKAGDRDFGPSAALDYGATVLGWMDRHLKRVDSLEDPAAGAGVRDGREPLANFRSLAPGRACIRTPSTWRVLQTAAEGRRVS